MEKTGDRFITKTEEPEHQPLPSRSILELHFHFQRLASMAGAAGVDRLGLHYDGDIPSASNLQASYVEKWLDLFSSKLRIMKSHRNTANMLSMTNC